MGPEAESAGLAYRYMIPSPSPQLLVELAQIAMLNFPLLESISKTLLKKHFC